MSDTDWRHILKMSEKELTKAEKDELCESISWMEADDIELNFSDLKSLFRLSQDILKYKSEQVKNLQGQLLEVKRRKGFRKRSTTITNDEQTQDPDLNLEKISQQEEAIKNNIEKIDILNAKIAELEEHRSNFEKNTEVIDRDSESSRDPLSELDAIDELEREVVTKNRHLRKLLSDIKVKDDENNQLRSKITIIKDKLSESTQVIEDLTEKMFTLNKESTKLKEALGKSQERNSQYLFEINALKQQISEGDAEKNITIEVLRKKILHWKNIVRSKTTENESLATKNMELSTNLAEIGASDTTSKPDHTQEHRIILLQDKLSEATNDIIESAKVIEQLKADNKNIKSLVEETPDYSALPEIKEDAFQDKENSLKKLKKTIYRLTNNIKEANNIISLREKELSEVRSELIILHSNEEGIKTLADDLKSKNRQLKLKDDKIKSFVQEINTINKILDDLQLENITMRQKLNILPNTKISTTGILKKMRIMETKEVESNKKLHELENSNINLELAKRKYEVTIKFLKSKLYEMGCSEIKLTKIINKETHLDVIDGEDFISDERNTNVTINPIYETEIKTLSEENEGLRKGLQEILDFLKESGTETGSYLALQCPSLEAVLRCMEARHSAGWFAPHMAVVLELRAALGGRDALHTALNNARKETYEIMTQLTKECKKTEELETKLKETELPTKLFESKDIPENESEGEIFGSWIDENNINDFTDKIEIDNLIINKNNAYNIQLKCGLNYFQKKFKYIFKKITELEIHAADENSKWAIKEENYKAEIERLKLQNQDDDNDSDISPGVVKYYSDPDVLKRKCAYLEESYKYIRTLNENIKNECLDFKLEVTESNAYYENKIQMLILKVTSLTNKLRRSINLDTFLKQNKILNEITVKYRKLTESNVHKNNNISLIKKIEEQKLFIINKSRKQIENLKDIDDNQQFNNAIENNILQKQLEVVCAALEESKKQSQKLENKIEEIQDAQNNLIECNLQTVDKEELALITDKCEKYTIENQALKDQCQHISSQLNIALLQLQQQQSKQMDNDMEINLLRHQILDLQSTGDNKAIIARLSGEILISHLQASECHKKIEKLQISLNKEKQNRVEAEELIKSREKCFSVYSSRYENKFRYLLDITNILRLQYHGSLPLISLENYLNNIEDLSRKNGAVDEKLNEIEDLGAILIAKHEVYDEILQVNKEQCVVDEDKCPHYLQNKINESIFKRELKHCNKKMDTLEKSRKETIERCNFLEKTLILINQVPNDKIIEQNNDDISELELEDLNSDEENVSRKSETITLPKPKILKPVDITKSDVTKQDQKDTVNIENPYFDRQLPKKLQSNELKENVSVSIQTNLLILPTKNKSAQTVTDKKLLNYEKEINVLKNNIISLEKQIDNYSNDLKQSLHLDNQKTNEISVLKTRHSDLEIKIGVLENSIDIKDQLNKKLQENLSHLNVQLLECQTFERNKLNTSVEETKGLFEIIKKLELDKKSIVEEYKILLTKEREEFAKNIKETQTKIFELQTQLSRKSSDSTNGESFKEIINKYSVKIVQLEDQKFKLQSDLDGCKTELSTYESELERWKSLAAERLNKMEQLNFQLEKRHSQEVDSYKAENEHWAFQAAEAQREQAELRARLAEQRSAHLKLLSEKDAHIDRLRNVVHNLKTQVLNMQTLITVNDPSFDLSAIVEVDESSDVLSQPSDRLELKFGSTMELEEYQDEAAKVPASSCSIWHDNVVDRLRREKQLIGKQNAILRRQIKALAGRERRSRLETQNLKNQVYRISTSGSKAATAESAVLQNKIASLQAQLSTAHRDTQSSVALWDKWKRAEQASERWQARFEEKCREVKKYEGSLNFTKSALTRLEREKRVLLSKLSGSQSRVDYTDEKEDNYERREEKATGDSVENEKDFGGLGGLASKVSVRALMERVEAQQRRIAALELADKGSEPLVSEYEKSLAEITCLKGQILRLESSILENQLRTPAGLGTPDNRPELDYWKSYCDMLKEENMQLSVKLSSVDANPGTPHHQRVNQLEQTVLTLRGLVSKLQSEQKSGVPRRGDSPQLTLDRSFVDKNKNQLDCYRNEISNLKKTIIDKDNLLERSKEMLKMAAEREEDLLRENTYLRHQLNELTKTKAGFLSA